MYHNIIVLNFGGVVFSRIDGDPFAPPISVSYTHLLCPDVTLRIWKLLGGFEITVQSIIKCK